MTQPPNPPPNPPASPPPTNPPAPTADQEEAKFMAFLAKFLAKEDGESGGTSSTSGTSDSDLETKITSILARHQRTNADTAERQQLSRDVAELKTQIAELISRQPKKRVWFSPLFD